MPTPLRLLLLCLLPLVVAGQQDEELAKEDAAAHDTTIATEKREIRVTYLRNPTAALSRMRVTVAPPHAEVTGPKNMLRITSDILTEKLRLRDKYDEEYTIEVALRPVQDMEDKVKVDTKTVKVTLTPYTEAEYVIRNGGFTAADPHDGRKPRYWDLPDGLGVQWKTAPAEFGAGHGKAIRINTKPSEAAMNAQWKKVGITKWYIPRGTKGPVAATYGLSYYSDPIPIPQDVKTPYRVSFDFCGKAGSKVWVRCYGIQRVRGEYDIRQRYETFVNCSGGGGWKHYSQVFYPKKHRPTVMQMRVMLYSFWPPEVSWFDNIRVEPISEAEYEKNK